VSDDPPKRRPVLQVVDDVPGEFAERVVEAFHDRRRPELHLGLTGGDVALACYDRLGRHADAQIDWWRVAVWWVDEEHDARPADAGGPFSRMAREHLLQVVGAAHALHPLPSDAQPERLDLVHLDLGADGTLSWVNAPGRLTLPLAVLDRVGHALVTACGADRHDALRAVLAGPGALEALVVGPARVTVLVDRDALRA
jgi:6-phosphogluconolactonase/glucosamine-6-phosphate isomerase/deaminase